MAAQTQGTSAGEATINPVFLRNMAALWATDPRLAQQIDDLPDEAVVEVEPSRAGPVTARMTGENGRPIYLHSKYDPRKEAEKLAASLEIDGCGSLFVMGFGLGYHVKALFAQLGTEGGIIIAEPSLPLLKTALEHVDLAEVLGSQRCFILTEIDKNLLSTRLGRYGARLLLGTRFAWHPASKEVAGSFLLQAHKALTDFLSYTRMSLFTLVTNARITNTNVANNLPTFVTTPSIAEIRGLLAGYPAIIVAAGPSLARNVELLREAKGRAVIIAVQTTFKTLLQYGIVPDFVTSLDYNEISTRFFEGIDDFHGVHLIAEPKATPGVIDRYGGPISLLDNTFARQCLGDGFEAKAGLKAGATVAHLAFYLAEHLGCDPVIFVGQDLAFTGGVFYTPGVEIHDAWRPELHRFHSIETKEWERIARHRAHLRRVEGVDGNAVYTDDHLFTYLQQFEADFAGSAARVIDATEGGTRKQHAEPMPLRDAIARFCAREIPAELWAYRGRPGGDRLALLARGRAAVERRRAEVVEFAALCAQMNTVLDELNGLVERPAEFNRRLARVDDLRLAVQQRDLIYGMVTSVSQQAELRRFAADIRAGEARGEGPARARAQLKRDREFVAALIDGAEVLTEILDGGIRRLDEAMAKAGTRRT